MYYNALKHYCHCTVCTWSHTLSKVMDQTPITFRSGGGMGYEGFVNQLYDQWLRRETWCAVTGLIPEKQRRHYPHKFYDDVQLYNSLCRGPYKARSGIRPVYFPPPRRMFPDLKNRSVLTGQL
ncbi:hypothetical protein Ocin01_02058 [Orchesella cincta]|uniref:Uncharacterized protein n=1 Tax=Orchesella cincta TaxID=48709 RepID=A0A1D2NH73_ORCCI|nr:hypothetical protein Ocin01_02058 [Orchesella cincta]